MVAPIANYLIAQAGDVGEELGIRFQMTITVAAMVRAGVIAAVVLTLSAIAPARKAANTKVRYAINPGSADNLQIEDLAQLRSRKFDVRIIIAGVVLTIMWLLIFIGNNFLFVQGNESVVSVFMFGGMALLVIGVSLLFYALTLPFERILILLSNAVTPRLTFFAGPNLLRAKQRNTVISLMVVFSATLPTFLGTMTALEQKNYDVEARFRYGAPVTAEVLALATVVLLQSEHRGRSVTRVFWTSSARWTGIEQAVGLTAEYNAAVTNKVELRRRGGAGAGPDWYAGRHRLRRSDRVLRWRPAGLRRDTVRTGHDHPGRGLRRVYGSGRRRRGAACQATGKDHVVDDARRGADRAYAGLRGIFHATRTYVRQGRSPGFVSLDTYLRLTHDPTVENDLRQRGLLARRARATGHRPHPGDDLRGHERSRCGRPTCGSCSPIKATCGYNQPPRASARRSNPCAQCAS